MKKIYLITGFVAIVVMFLAFAPEDRILLVKTKYNHILRDPGQLCFDYHAITLKDPKTAEILDVSKSPDRLSVTYRAKNGFGAYSTDKFGCRLTKGEFTEFNQAFENISIRLRAGMTVSQEDFDVISKDTARMPPSELVEIQYLRRTFYYQIR